MAERIQAPTTQTEVAAAAAALSERRTKDAAFAIKELGLDSSRVAHEHGHGIERFEEVGAKDGPKIDESLVSGYKAEIASGRELTVLERAEGVIKPKEEAVIIASLMAAERDMALERNKNTLSAGSLYSAAQRVSRGISVDGERITSDDMQQSEKVLDILSSQVFWEAVEEAINLDLLLEKNRLDDISKETGITLQYNDRAKLRELQRHEEAVMHLYAGEGDFEDKITALQIPHGLLEKGMRIYRAKFDDQLELLHSQGNNEAWKLRVLDMGGMDDLESILRGESPSAVGRTRSVTGQAAREGKVPSDQFTYRRTHLFLEIRQIRTGYEASAEVEERLIKIAEGLGENSLGEVRRVELV